MCLPAGKKSISCFPGGTAKICKLILGTFSMPAFTQQKWHHQLVENFNIYLHAKNKVRHVLLPWDIETLEFYWLTAFGPITGDPEFCQIPDWCWNINNNISFHFRLFSRKTNYKIFQNFQKSLFWGRFDFFAKNLGKNEFCWKKELCQFLNITIIYHRAINQKKLLCYLWGKCWTDRWMDKQVEGQTDNCDFVGPSVKEGSNY